MQDILLDIFIVAHAEFRHLFLDLRHADLMRLSLHREAHAFSLLGLHLRLELRLVELLLFAGAVYFLICFSASLLVKRFQKRVVT